MGHLLPAGTPPESPLSRAWPHALQQVRGMALACRLGDGTAEQGRLVVAPPEQPAPMQRNRRNHFAVFNELGPGADHPTRKGRRRVGAIRMLEAQYQIAAPLFITQSGSGAAKWRPSRGAGRTQPRRSDLVLERSSATGAARSMNEVQFTPAARAQAFRIGHVLPAIQTAGRQQRVEQKPSRGGKHIH